MRFPKKIYLFSAVSIIVSVLLALFLIFPFFKKIQDNSAEIITQKEKLLSFQLETEAMENFKFRQEEVKKELEKAESLFVDPDMPLDFFIFLEKNSSELNLDMEVLPKNYFFQVSITGKYSKFLEFLEKLQNSPYLVEVQNFGLSKEKDGNIKANLSLKAFAK